jgi:putative cardiolipin synthase
MPRRVSPLVPLLALILPESLASAGSEPPWLTEAALPPGEDSPLDRLVAPREAQHPGLSAFKLVEEGPDAFVIRARSARLAMRSLDIQTFIWRADLTGELLAYRALEAADRGVKVRLLIDGLDARRNFHLFAALAAHRNMAVRVFNPFDMGRGTGGFAGALLNFDRLNRRMHNKTWIADNRMAIVGGRNLADEYFDASDRVNFVDLDFALFGPIVREASNSFDRYWNSGLAYPIETLSTGSVNQQALAAIRIELGKAAIKAWKSRYAQELLADDAVQRLIAGDWEMRWTGDYLFAADDPHKVTQARASDRTVVGQSLLEAVRQARSDLVLISPYFVPGEDIARLLVDIAKSGARVRVLTNSLAASDVSAVHGGYSRYRETLLAGGVEIWELKASDGRQPREAFHRPSDASLHTKALLIDGRRVFVGSYNLDPRSAWLNCEQGVLIENEALAGELDDIFARQTTGERAWKVTLNEGRVAWNDGRETFSQDPHASVGQRLLAWLVRVMRLDAQL